MPNFCLGWSHSFYYLGQEANLISAPGWYTTSIFQGNLLHKHPWKSYKQKTKELSWRIISQHFVSLVVSSGSMVLNIIIWMILNL